MKKSLLFLLVAMILIFVPVAFGASELPYRHATEVSDVTDPYTADEDIVSDQEEPEGDENVSNAPECDIRAVIACYDQDFLRIDILLNHEISNDFIVWYAVKFHYESMDEYYTYYPVSKELIYEKEVNGKVVQTKELSKSKTDDWAGVCDSGDDVYIIINKDAHMSGTPGKRYFLSTYVMSGYVDKHDKMQMADDTIEVNMEFKR